MIIYIDRTISEVGKNQELTKWEQTLYEKLAYAHKNGFCLLCGHFDSIEYLMQSLEGTESKVYRKIRNKQSETKSIIQKVEKLLVLSHSDTPDLPDYIQEKCRLIKVENAGAIRIDRGCSLICENLNDCMFYTIMAKRYCHDYGIKLGNSVDLSFVKDPGGGSTMHQLFKERICNDKVLALCVVDSDRKYGGRQVPLGGTAQKMKDTIKEINKQQKTDETLYELCCIPVHEAENLIPIAVLKAIEKDVPTMEAGVLYLQKMIQAGHSDAVLLYDFKNGGKTIKEDKDHQKKDWVREALPYWNGLSKEINDYSMPGLCKGLLEKAINALNNPNEGSYFESVEIDDYLKVHWAEIGRKVFTWGCAKKPDYI